MTMRQRALCGAVLGGVLVASGAASAQTFSEVQDRVGNTSCPVITDWTSRILFDETNHTNWANVGTLPRKKEFVPLANRAGMTVKRILMFGDMGAMNGDRTPRVDDPVRALFARADLILGNVEAPVTNHAFPDSSSSQIFSFHVSAGYLRSFMAQHCVDPKKAVFTVANNHADDNGHWVDTLANVCSNTEWGLMGGTTCKPASSLGGAQFVGIDFAPKDSAAIRTVDVGGLKVGIAAWTHVQNKRPARDGAGNVLPTTWEGSLDVVGRDFRTRKSLLGVELLIGLPHWDCQFNDYPHAETVAAAHSLANSGFDLLAGAHPSVMQPANMVGSSRASLAFYSLGALGSPLVTPEPPLTMVLVEVLVNTAGQLLEYQLHPIVERMADSTLAPTVDCFGVNTGFTDFARPTTREVVLFETAMNDAIRTGNRGARDALLKAESRLNELFR